MYDRYLSTMGGGERYACGFAAALVDLGVEVEMVSDEHVDLRAVESRLRIDLTGVGMRRATIRHDNQVATLSAEYDLFVNATYLSVASSVADRSIRLVNFPEPGVAGLRRRLLAPERLARLRRRLPQSAFGAGFRPVDPVGGSLGYWSAPGGTIHLAANAPTDLALLLRLPHRGTTAIVNVHVRTPDGTVLGRRLVEAGQRTWLEVQRPRDVTCLHVEPTGFVPAIARIGEPDTEFAGVIVDVVAAAGDRPFTRTTWHRRRLSRAVRLRHLDSYDLLLANSAFTARWVDRGWGRAAQVLHPPCDPPVSPTSAPRVNRILHVGRFFEPGEAAHHKHQLELVEAYRELPADVQRDWALVLVGGVHPGAESYVQRVRRAASGGNIEVITDTPGDVLDTLFATSRIYWHATGLGVSEARLPELQEHFGITTVEAMACGLVPVVIDQGGQPEIVRDGVDGLRWRTTSELLARTMQLVEDPALLGRLSGSATARARDFTTPAFRARVHELVTPLLEQGRRP